MSPSFPILTYHSQIFHSNRYFGNDHIALARDLEMIYKAGMRIAPLSDLVDWLEQARDDRELEGSIFLTFDDGSNFDVQDLDHPEFGVQRSFKGVMEDFVQHHGSNLPGNLHATSFVIASEANRKQIDAQALFGRDWMSSDWWRETDAAGLIAIENHSWDHNHPALGGDGRGNFHSVDTPEQCRQQIVRASRTIGEITGRQPEFFAYPFGESNAFLREAYFPGFREEHGCKAAFGTEPAHVARSSDRWNLPRYVCGRDWTDPEGLLRILERGRAR